MVLNIDKNHLSSVQTVQNHFWLIPKGWLYIIQQNIVGILTIHEVGNPFLSHDAAMG